MMLAVKHKPQANAVELAQLGGVIPHSVGKCPEGTKGKGFL